MKASEAVVPHTPASVSRTLTHSHTSYTSHTHTPTQLTHSRTVGGFEVYGLRVRVLGSTCPVGLGRDRVDPGVDVHAYEPLEDVDAD